jgi:dTDP-4-amino-4,6-dideoxygalactose transaminase
LRLLAGRSTEFLVPWWGSREFELAEQWLKGREVEDVRDAVAASMAARLGGGQAILLDSGRAALHLALAVAGVGEADRVGLTAYSCGGVIRPVVAVGATPVLVDIDDELNMDLASVVEAHRLRRLSAVVLPHLGGVWSRHADEIVSWARDEGITVVEDVAQSTGLAHAGTSAGALGDMAITSTGRGKPLFGAAGGALITRSPEASARAHALLQAPRPRHDVALRLREFLRRYPASAAARRRADFRSRLSPPIARRGPVPQVGETLPAAMSTVDAALAQEQLARLDEQMALRREAAARWVGLLEPLFVQGLEHAPLEGTASKFWVSAATPRGHRAVDSLRAAARHEGVEVEFLYTPLNLRAGFASAIALPTPNTERRWRHTFSLPVRPGLTNSDWHRMAAVATRAAG